MSPDEIRPVMTYAGGKNGDLRTVVDYGADKRWVGWAPTRERLPLGGFMRTRYTSRIAFAKWASHAVPQEADHVD